MPPVPPVMPLMPVEPDTPDGPDDKDAPRAFALAALVLGTAVGAAGAHQMSVALGQSGRSWFVAAAVFVVGMGIAVTRVDRWHPFPRFGPANVVTSVRLLLTALVCGLAIERRDANVAAAAIAISLAVTALDGIDGYVARATRLASAFGARFDMEVDALLIMALSTLAWSQDKAGAWVLLSGLMRYLFVVAGWVIPWMGHTLPPSRRRQAACVMQIVALVATIAPSTVPPVSTAIAAAALGLLAGSFGIDGLWLWRHRDSPAPPTQPAQTW